MPQIVWIMGPDGRSRYMNRLGKEKLGEAMINRPHEVVHPDDFERRRRIWQASLETGEPYACELRIKSPEDGRYRWYLARATPVRAPDGAIRCWYGVTVDIQALKSTEQQLREERTRLEATAAASPSVLHTFLLRKDGSMSFPYASPAIESIYGVTAEQLREDASITQSLIHPDDADMVERSVYESIGSRQPWYCVFRINHPKRGTIWVEGRSRPVEMEGGDVAWHGVLTDVTETRRLTYQLSQAQKMEAVGRLAGGIAHDFNNLLTVILGECDFGVAQLPPDSPQRQSFAIIQKTASKAAALTKQLLAFSRRQPVTPCVLDLNELLRSSQDLVERLVGKSVECDMDLWHEPLLVHADRNQLEQVIYNLACNARDAMPKAGRLSIRTKRVDEQGSNFTKHWVELTVQDTGEGLSTHQIDRLFEPFFSTKEPGKGTGLGLAVVHGIVEQCQGQVSATSVPEGGALFRVLLPEQLQASESAARDRGGHGEGI